MSNLIVSQINGGPTGVINAIINGNFGINQRGVSGTVTLTAGVYGHDRWKAGSGGCTYTFATVDNVTTLTITAGSLIQVIEGLNLYSGTYTLSWTGTAQGKIGAGSYAGSGVTGAAVGGTNLNIEFNTGTVSLVQFEQGSVATPFERRPYGTELALCQRYYCLLSPYMVFSYTTTSVSGKLQFPVTMRATPTGAYFSGNGQIDPISGANISPSSISVNAYPSDKQAANIICNNFSGLTNNKPFWMREPELITSFSAEL